MSSIKKITLFTLMFGLITFILLHSHLQEYIKEIDRRIILSHVHKLIKNKTGFLACKHPNLPVFAPEIMKFVHTVPKLDCSEAEEDWVKCMGYTCSIQERANIKHSPLECKFTDILRVDDFTITRGKISVTDMYILEQSDVVHVSCNSQDRKWSATLTGIRHDTNIWDRAGWSKLPKHALKMNVLMFGFDSLSRNAFIRKLPKSYEYLTKVLEAVVLKGYNIVGDGTPQALIPMLTGKTELELPDTRKRLKGTKYVDVYPFIWNDYKKAGYVTGFFEDTPDIGTFTYRLRGFKKVPTDHYMRPYYLANLKEQHKWPRLCTGEIPRHKVMMNAIKNFFTVYKTKPKFLFGFHGEISHDDYNLVGVADDDLLELLKDLNHSGALNDTILIIMADHGHRFADVRNTLQGKQEERLPFFSFTFPKWFQEKHRRIYHNFQSNRDKLTTPFDIYATLKSILSLEECDEADIAQRSLSLFTKIPAKRSCSHAYIEPHWCACLDWVKVPVTEPFAERLGQKLVDTINEYTKSFRRLCEALVLSQIHWVTKMSPNQDMLKFKKNLDIDGFEADLTADTKIKEEIYQIKVILMPGNSLFEASVTHHLTTDKLEMKLSDVSRTNKYGNQTKCIKKNLPQLRKFCYCKH